MIELRWTRPATGAGKTITEMDRLQWREVEDNPQGEIEVRGWTDVPVVIVYE